VIRVQLALHRLLRRVLPRHVREQRGADMDRTFVRMLEEDRRGRLRVWVGEVSDLLATGIRMRRQGSARGGRLAGVGLDFKVGLRMLSRNPGITAVAVFALAVGIPVGLAPWHLVNALEGPLPVDEGDRVLMLRYWNGATSRPDPTKLDDLARWRATLTGFEALAATRRAHYNIGSAEGMSRAVHGAEVTATTFDILRVPPLHGRTIAAADEVPGAPDVVLIGYDLWRTQFGADPEVVGDSLRIGGALHTVIGVMPEGFLFPVDESLWLPLREQLADVPFEGLPLVIFGRLADGVSAPRARNELGAVVERMKDELPDSQRELRGEVVPFALMLTGAQAGGLRAELGFYVVQVLALLLLLVACVNVGMLIFARTSSRTRELAVRATLGAGRARIVRQMLTECGVLALIAVASGMLLADQGLRFLQRWASSGGLPYWVDLTVSWQTASRGLGLAALSAVAAGVVPALKVTGKSLQRSLRGGPGNRAGIRFGGVSGALIVGDVALAILLIGIAGAALDNVVSSDRSESVGIDPGAYLTAQVRLPGLEPAADTGASGERGFVARVAATQQNLVQRLEREPGVLGVAIGTRLPRMDHPGRRVEVEGETVDEGFRGHAVQVARVAPGFFDALESPVLLGRGFDSRDIGENRSTVIVNTTFVEQVLGGRNPIGVKVRYAGGARPGGGVSFASGAAPGPWLEIIGVVARLGMNMATPAQDAGMYLPLAPGDLHPLLLGIHTGGDPAEFAPRLRKLVEEVDANAVALGVEPLDEVLQDDLVSIYLFTTGGTLMVAILVMLAATGIYAIMSFTVASRTREIGIRTSLGAKRRDVVRTVSGRSLAQLGVGALLGVAVSWWLLSVLKYGAGWIPAYSPLALAFLAATGVVTLIGVPACMAPTLRALRIDPTEAMRSE
jgi:predicted permease